MSTTDTAFAFDSNLPLSLPCGRHVTVVPLDGHTQKRFSPDREGHFRDVEGALTFAVSRIIKTVNGRTFDPTRMEREALAMPTGSRMRAFMAGRTLTYGAACRFEWQCAACSRRNETTRDLDAGLPEREGAGGAARVADAAGGRVEDVPYSDELLREGFTFKVPLPRASLTVRVVVDTGATASAFAAAAARGDCGPLDAPLAQIVELDGKPLSKRNPFNDILSLPGSTLDAIRRVVGMMEPREFLDAADEHAWIEKANEQLRGYGNDVPETEEDAAPVLWVPQGGPRLRMHLKCDGCGSRAWAVLSTSPDFFVPHLRSALDE